MESDQLYGWNEGIDISQLCRVCANPDDNLIPIFEGEGLEQELKMKIDKHLPIKVSWDDLLPASICYNCATTLTAWHFLSSECVLAEQKLRALVLSPKEEALEEEFAATSPSPGDDEDDPPSDSELPAEYLYSSNQEFESNDQKEELPSDSEDPVYYPYSCDQDIEQEALEENHPSGGEFARDPDFASSVADVPEDSELLLESNDSRKHAIKKVQPYTVTTDQRRIIKKRSMKPKVVLVKCSKQSKLTVEEQITKALNYLNTRGSESGQNLIKKKLQYAPSPVKILHKTIQQTHKSILESTRNISDQSFFKSGMERVDVPDEEHYDETEPSLEYTEEVHEGDEANKESATEMAFAQTLSKEDVIYSEYHSENSDKKDYSVNIKPENEMDQKSNFQTDIVPTSEMPKSFSSVVTLPSHFLVQNVNSGYNVLYYVPPGISDAGVEEVNTTMNINNSNESALKILKSGNNESVGLQSQQFVIVPMNTTIQHDPTVSRSDQKRKRTFFKCGVCNKLFKRKVYLSSHQMTIHDDLKCHRCGIKLENANSLSVHIKSHLNTKNSAKVIKKARKVAYEPAICDVCGKKLQNPMSLTRHMMLHTGIRPFACDLCQKTFCTKLSRDDHRHTHTGEKPYVCDMCGRMFSYRSHLSLHRNSHSDERPYECAFCKKRFNRRQYLILHIRTHTGEKPYACDICSRAFAQRNDMNKHRLTHSSDRAYMCKCGLSFRQKRDFHRHEREHDVKEENCTSDNHIVYIEGVEDPNSLELI